MRPSLGLVCPPMPPTSALITVTVIFIILIIKYFDLYYVKNIAANNHINNLFKIWSKQFQKIEMVIKPMSGRIRHECRKQETTLKHDSCRTY